MPVRQRTDDPDDPRSPNVSTTKLGNELSLGFRFVVDKTYSSTELDHVTIMFVFTLFNNNVSNLICCDF